MTLSEVEKVFEGQVFAPTYDAFETYLYVEVQQIRNDECCWNTVYSGLDVPISFAETLQSDEVSAAFYTNN